jgi:predicted DNA-binding protein (UPF0251 family)
MDEYMNERWRIELEALGEFTLARTDQDTGKVDHLSVKGDEFREFWSDFWSSVRQRGMEKRAETVADRLAGPVELPDWLTNLLEECRAEFTPRQTEALVYTYGYGLSLQEAASALGVKKQTFRKRLAGAQHKVEHLTAQVLRERRIIEGLDVLEADHVFEYLTPLGQRQRRWERAVPALHGLNAE